MVQQRSDSLMKTSSGYLATSRAVKRQQQCRKYKMIAAVVCVVLVSFPHSFFNLDVSVNVICVSFLLCRSSSWLYCFLFAGLPSHSVRAVIEDYFLSNILN